MVEFINFEEIIDREFKEEVKPRPPNTLYCSEIGYCLRRIYLNCITPKETPVEVMRKFAVGNMIHDRVTSILRKTFDSVSSEQSVVMYLDAIDFRVLGRYDDIIHQDEGKILLEKKSVNTLKFIDKPIHHHLIQTHLYMKCLGMDKAQIMYIEKNTFKTKTFNIKFQHWIFQEAMHRINIIANALKTKRTPAPEARNNMRMKWQCRYCPFYRECS